MRTLELNKTKLWYTTIDSYTDEMDGILYTGNELPVYSTPVVVYLSLYPANGAIGERIFGKDAQLDMVSVSNTVVLAKHGLLFLTEPLSNYRKTYDYEVDRILDSLNTLNYGLKNRV